MLKIEIIGIMDLKNALRACRSKLNVICSVIEKERKKLYICELLVEPRGGA